MICFGRFGGMIGSGSDAGLHSGDCHRRDPGAGEWEFSKQLLGFLLVVFNFLGAAFEVFPCFFLFVPFQWKKTSRLPKRRQAVRR